MRTLNCNSQEEVYILKYRRCGEALGNDKAETKFWARFNNYKVHTVPIEKNVMCPSTLSMKIMGSKIIMDMIIGSWH